MLLLNLDKGPVLNENSRLKEQLDSLLREHLHEEAAFVARRMVAIADSVLEQRRILGTVGMHTSSGFIKGSNAPTGHMGYDYLTNKGYLVGVCASAEAIALCRQAEEQKWDGEWTQRIEDIQHHEVALKEAKCIIAHAPGIIQSNLLKQQHPQIDSTLLYYAAKRGEIVRIPKGRSYSLWLPS